MPAGDRYVEVTLEDMEQFLKRAFRTLKPKKSVYKGQFVFDLQLSDDGIFVRVYSSIRPHSGAAKGIGEDSIKVTLITKGGKPLVRKDKIIMRTKNWKSTLQDRVEELHETYESKAEYWKDRRRERDGESGSRDTMRSVGDDEAEVMMLEEMNAEGAPSRLPVRPPPSDGPGVTKTKPGQGFEGGYRYENGQVGVEVPVNVATPGLEGMGVSKGGKRERVRLKEKIKGPYPQYNTRQPVELWTFDNVSGRARQWGGGGSRWAETDPLAERVAERFANA